MNSNENFDRNDLLFTCKSSARYHQARMRFFHLINHSIQFTIFVFAMTGVSTLIITEVGKNTFYLIWPPTIAILTLFHFMFNPADKASLHRFLHRSFIMLTGEIDGTKTPSEKTITRWKNTMYSLFTEEPPTYRALVAHCDDQVVISLGKSKEHLTDMCFFYRCLRNIYPFQGAKFLTEYQKNLKNFPPPQTTQPN